MTLAYWHRILEGEESYTRGYEWQSRVFLQDSMQPIGLEHQVRMQTDFGKNVPCLPEIIEETKEAAHMFYFWD